MNPGLIKGFEAQAAVKPKRLVTLSGGKLVYPSSAQEILGSSDRGGAPAGAFCDVVLSGIAEVELGGPVSEMQRITYALPDEGETADGTAVVAVTTRPSAGIALASGVAGHIIPFLVERIPATTQA